MLVVRSVVKCGSTRRPEMADRPRGGIQAPFIGTSVLIRHGPRAVGIDLDAGQDEQPQPDRQQEGGARSSLGLPRRRT